ncbi:MAG: hypothetical protein IT338_09595 [Thermomicrobiales bacterium]|nr:hypothetical protein [Thermomicrobiales bacterium]
MSQRGRGSGPFDDFPEDEEPGQEPGGAEPPFASSQPIAPYDPYRSASGGASRGRDRDRDEDLFAPRVRRPSRSSFGDPFLPDDDPLNAEAWQLDLDEVDYADEPFDESIHDIEFDEAPPPRRPRRQPPATRVGRGAPSGTGLRRTSRRTSAAAAPRRGRVARSSISLTVPRAVAGSSLVADPGALMLLAISAVSILLMVLLLAVRIGGLPAPLVLSLDPAGNPDRWGPPRVLWRLPLMAFFSTLMFLAVAWFLHPMDRFAARFALGAAIVAQLVVWVALAQHLFGG